MTAQIINKFDGMDISTILEDGIPVLKMKGSNMYFAPGVFINQKSYEGFTTEPKFIYTDGTKSYYNKQEGAA